MTYITNGLKECISRRIAKERGLYIVLNSFINIGLEDISISISSIMLNWTKF